MKQYFVLVVMLTLITNSQCGLLDGILGTVKNTTSSVTHTIGGALHYGKSFVFGGNETDETGRSIIKPGIIGTISLKIHDVAENVREEVRTVFSMFDHTQGHGKGIIGRFLDRVKCKVFKIKSFLFENSVAHIENRPNPPVKLGNDTKILCEKLRKYFFKNNTSDVSGLRQTLVSLHDAINRIRKNVTQSRTDKDDEDDSAGLIDIRSSVGNIAGGLQDDFENGVDTDYDKIEDGGTRGKVKDSRKKVSQNTNEFIENQRRIGDSAKKFQGDVENSLNDVGGHFRDESDKMKDLMENSYKKSGF